MVTVASRHLARCLLWGTRNLAAKLQCLRVQHSIPSYLAAAVIVILALVGVCCLPIEATLTTNPDCQGVVLEKNSR